MPDNQQSYSQNHNLNQDFFAIKKVKKLLMHEPIVELLDNQLNTWRGSMYLAVQIQTGFFCTGLPVRILK